MVMLTKSIESTERLVELKMKMYDRSNSLMVMDLLMEKLEQLNADLASMVSEVRLTNPIVGNVLDNAKIVMGLVTTVNRNMGGLKCDVGKSMGMPKRDEDYDNGEDGVEDEDLVEKIIKD